MCQSRDFRPPGSALDIDWEHLQQISDSNMGFAFELLTLFAQDTEAKVEALREAAYTGDVSEFQELTHYVKGAAANVGMRTIVAIAQHLETQEPSRDRATIDLLLSTLEATLQAVINLVQKYS